MSSSEYEKIQARLPWVKDWDPRRPSYMGDPKSKPEILQEPPPPIGLKCRAINVRNELDALLKSNFEVTEEDVPADSLRSTYHPHRWSLKEGIVVYFICNKYKGIVIRTNWSKNKSYGLGSVVAGVKVAIEQRRFDEEVKERRRKKVEEKREALRKLEDFRKEMTEGVKRKLDEEQRKREEWERSWTVRSVLSIPGIVSVGKTEAGERLAGIEYRGMKNHRDMKQVISLLAQVFEVFEKVTEG